MRDAEIVSVTPEMRDEALADRVPRMDDLIQKYDVIAARRQLVRGRRSGRSTADYGDIALLWDRCRAHVCSINVDRKRLLQGDIAETEPVLSAQSMAMANAAGMDVADRAEVLLAGEAQQGRLGHASQQMVLR